MENKILVETSARHIHLTDEALKILGIEALEVKTMLSQPGQFASNTNIPPDELALLSLSIVFLHAKAP